MVLGDPSVLRWGVHTKSIVANNYSVNSDGLQPNLQTSTTEPKLSLELPAEVRVPFAADKTKRTIDLKSATLSAVGLRAGQRTFAIVEAKSLGLEISELKFASLQRNMQQLLQRGLPVQAGLIFGTHVGHKTPLVGAAVSMLVKIASGAAVDLQDLTRTLSAAKPEGLGLNITPYRPEGDAQAFLKGLMVQLAAHHAGGSTEAALLLPFLSAAITRPEAATLAYADLVAEGRGFLDASLPSWKTWAEPGTTARLEAERFVQLLAAIKSIDGGTLIDHQSALAWVRTLQFGDRGSFGEQAKASCARQAQLTPAQLEDVIARSLRLNAGSALGSLTRLTREPNQASWASTGDGTVSFSSADSADHFAYLACLSMADRVTRFSGISEQKLVSVWNHENLVSDEKFLRDVAYAFGDPQRLITLLKNKPEQACLYFGAMARLHSGESTSTPVLTPPIGKDEIRSATEAFNEGPTYRTSTRLSKLWGQAVATGDIAAISAAFHGLSSAARKQVVFGVSNQSSDDPFGFDGMGSLQCSVWRCLASMPVVIGDAAKVAQAQQDLEAARTTLAFMNPAAFAEAMLRTTGVASITPPTRLDGPGAIDVAAAAIYEQLHSACHWDSSYLAPLDAPGALDQVAERVRVSYAGTADEIAAVVRQVGELGWTEASAKIDQALSANKRPYQGWIDQLGSAAELIGAEALGARKLDVVYTRSLGKYLASSDLSYPKDNEPQRLCEIDYQGNITPLKLSKFSTREWVKRYYKDQHHSMRIGGTGYTHDPVDRETHRLKNVDATHSILATMFAHRFAPDAAPKDGQATKADFAITPELWKRFIAQCAGLDGKNVELAEKIELVLVRAKAHGLDPIAIEAARSALSGRFDAAKLTARVADFEEQVLRWAVAPKSAPKPEGLADLRAALNIEVPEGLADIRGVLDAATRDALAARLERAVSVYEGSKKRGRSAIVRNYDVGLQLLPGVAQPAETTTIRGTWLGFADKGELGAAPAEILAAADAFQATRKDTRKHLSLAFETRPDGRIVSLQLQRHEGLANGLSLEAWGEGAVPSWLLQLVISELAHPETYVYEPPALEIRYSSDRPFTNPDNRRVHYYTNRDDDFQNHDGYDAIRPNLKRMKATAKKLPSEERTAALAWIASLEK
jgi:hypothetical protein